jgi:hypothetical protein
MGLYEKLLEERAQEERRRGRPLGAFHGADFPVLDRRLADAPQDRPRGTAAICACSVGTSTRGCVLKAQRCASPA